MLQAAPHATHFKRILNFGEGQVNINYAMRNSAELSVMARQKGAAIKILQLNWFVDSTMDAFFAEQGRIGVRTPGRKYRRRQ